MYRADYDKTIKDLNLTMGVDEIHDLSEIPDGYLQVGVFGNTSRLYKLIYHGYHHYSYKKHPEQKRAVLFVKATDVEALSAYWTEQITRQEWNPLPVSGHPEIDILRDDVGRISRDVARLSAYISDQEKPRWKRWFGWFWRAA